ncbi:MAG: glycoside hydrolase family 38 C-terminal domain-containing protein [Candidatus Binataceae bacterium]
MDQLYFVIHTHWDREWYQPFQEMRARLVSMTSRMLRLLEEGEIPCFHFDGQTIVLEDYLEVHPQDAKRIAKLVKAEKLQIGPWYVLADSFLASGEALIRNLEIGARIASRFGPSTPVGYMPDQFGHCAQLPQIMTGFGLKAAVVFRGVPAAVNRGHFAWEALDGTEITTIYLPFGYSNGAALPADSAEALIARAENLAEREREFAGGAPILIMNGVDHSSPDPRIYRLLNELNGRTPFTFETGTLEGYAAKLAALPPDGAPRHRGELRSPARANVTPGVTSIRSWMKQRDFEISYLLERIADPLAAFAALRGPAPDLAEYLEMAWREAIQNHPHDSITGCSVDQVHRDMRYRFDQAAMLGRIVTEKAIGIVLDENAPGEAVLAVLNPAFARRALVAGQAELEDPNASYDAVDASGRRFPIAIGPNPVTETFEYELSAGDAKAGTAGPPDAPVMGWYANRFEVRQTEPMKYEVKLFLSRSPARGNAGPELRKQIAAVPDEARLRLCGVAATRAPIAFVADGLTQAGFGIYRIERTGAASGCSIEGEGIENEFFRVTPSPRGMTIEVVKTGKTLELYFEDEGDRGDEYSFDPVAGSPAVTTPAKIAVKEIERGPVLQRLALSMVFNLPASLADDRRLRSNDSVEVAVELEAAIYAGFDRIDFTASVDNRARDHRLRVALATPIAASESISDTNFGIVRRPLDSTEPAGPTEDVYPTAPHRAFTAIESKDLSAALMSRGIYETEVRRGDGGTAILLTLLRCVGWLSRGDLVMRRVDAGPAFPTPDAQEIGLHRFEFAVTAWPGGFAGSDLVQMSQAYAYPPKLFPARAGCDVSELRLCGCDNPKIVFSTARAMDRPKSYVVRAFSASEEPETARFDFGPGRKARAIDLAGHPTRDLPVRRRRDGTSEVKLRPFQIATFEVRADASRK